MTKFNFFRGYIGTLNMMSDHTYTTASLVNPDYYRRPNTFYEPEVFSEHVRRLEQMRNHALITHEQYLTQRDVLVERERARRGITEDQIRLYNTTRVTTINPTFWTKIKMFGTGVKLVLKETWRTEPIGLVVITLLSLLVSFIGIMKLLGK